MVLGIPNVSMPGSISKAAGKKRRAPTPLPPSPGPTPPPKTTPYPPGLHYPRNKHDCLKRHVLPPIRPPLDPPSLDTPDLHAALDLLLPGSTLRVHAHTGLVDLLLRQVDSLVSSPKDNPTVLGPGPDDWTGTAMHKSTGSTEYVKTIQQWAKTTAQAHATARSLTLKTETQVANAWFELLAEPINDFLYHRSTYYRAPNNIGRWYQANGASDWVALMSDNAPRAFMKWKMGLATSDIELLSLTALGWHSSDRVRVSPGFEIANKNGRLWNSAGISANPVYACLLAWSHSHFYRARWGLLFNGGVAMLTYLAKPDSLFVSQPIYRDAGREGGVTLALVMAALCILDERDACRPSVTMNHEAIVFYPRPSARAG